MRHKVNTTRSLSLLDLVCSNIGASERVAETAKDLYQRLSSALADQGIYIVRKTRLRYTAATAFQACIEHREPITSREVCKYFGLEVKYKTAVDLRRIINKHGIKMKLKDDSDVIEDMIRSRCPDLDLEPHIEEIIDVVTSTSNLRTDSDLPETIAAACVLFVINSNGLTTDKKEAIDLFSAQYVGVNIAYKKINEFFEKEIKSGIVMVNPPLHLSPQKTKSESKSDPKSDPNSEPNKESYECDEVILIKNELQNYFTFQYDPEPDPQSDSDLDSN